MHEPPDPPTPDGSPPPPNPYTGGGQTPTDPPAGPIPHPQSDTGVTGVPDGVLGDAGSGRGTQGPPRPEIGPEGIPKTAGVLAWLVLLAALGTAIVWQNLPERAQRGALGLPPIVIGEPAPLVSPDQVAMQAKMNLQLGHEFESLSPGSGAQFHDPLITTLEGYAAGVSSDGEPDPEYEILIAMVAGETEGPEEALIRLGIAEDRIEELDRLEDASAETGRRARYLEQRERRRNALRDDLPALFKLYEDGSASLEDFERERLTNRWGYFGRLAQTWDLDDTAPDRRALLDTSMLWRLVGLVALMGIAGVALVAGLVFLILGLVKLASGRLRVHSRRYEVRGSALVETVAVFAGAFAVMVIGTTFFASKYPWVGVVQLPLQWMLLLTVLWPLVRGWKGADWRAAFGVHAGRGVFREIGAGFIAYLAAVPVFMAGAVVTFVLIVLEQLILGPSAVPETNPVLDIIANGDLVTVLLLASLACIWAPVCEELIFRGALFAQLRTRWHWVPATIVSALAFAYLHSYGPLMLAPIISLGLMFAFMRWWRGSIIACVTAHFLHNASVTCLLVVLSGIVTV